tara:strand:+ start:577 stop:1014 length:438 start_codon:yes stop_codon:yes gene_type:complete
MVQRTIFPLAAILICLSAPVIAREIHWEKCRPGQPNTPDKTCVVDGDTIWIEGVNVRMEGYDTPEPQTNLCGGEREKALAEQASDRLVELMNTRSWTLELSGSTGGFGREIGTIYIDGRDVGEILVEERLARWWPDGDEWWCELR